VPMGQVGGDDVAHYSARDQRVSVFEHRAIGHHRGLRGQAAFWGVILAHGISLIVKALV